MRTVIDEQGRVEIPGVLRDRLHLTPGVVVDVEPNENGLSVTPVENAPNLPVNTPTLLREGSHLVIRGSESLSLEEANRALEAGRDERINQIMGGKIESQWPAPPE